TASARAPTRLLSPSGPSPARPWPAVVRAPTGARARVGTPRARARVALALLARGAPAGVRARRAIPRTGSPCALHVARSPRPGGAAATVTTHPLRPSSAGSRPGFPPVGLAGTPSSDAAASAPDRASARVLVVVGSAAAARWGHGRFRSVGSCERT